MKKIIMLIIILPLCLSVKTGFSRTAIELMNEGRMNLYKGEISQGIGLLEEAHRMDANSPHIILLLARGYSWNNEWNKAKALYNEIIAASAPSDLVHWEARFGIAQVTSWERKYDEGITLYQQIIDSPENTSKNLKFDSSVAIGDIYSWKMESDKAIGQYNRLLDSNPDNILLLNRIARTYLWNGEYQKSRAYSSKALSVDGNDRESAERLRILNQIKPFTATAGYDFTMYDTENTRGEKIKAHNAVLGLTWQHSVPFRVFGYVTHITQNSIESADPEKTSGWNYDVNLRGGFIYRINSLTYVSVAADYTHDAKIFPDYSSEISISRKLTPHIDFFGLYKYTYDKIDSTQTVESKQYNLLSPGIVYYFTPASYNRLQFYVESDRKDLFYSMLIHQCVSLNPENIINFYAFLSQGRSYLTFSDTTVLQKVTTYSITLAYAHYFTSSWGIELSSGFTTRVDSYNNYHAGIRGICKW